MALNYDKIRHNREDGGNHWTSYSDLFLVLSVVFLLLYVIANIRAGTLTVMQQNQVQQAKTEADALKKQIKAYEVLKEDYVKDGASKDEVQMYRDLMDHMDLLQGDAKKERDEARAKAQAADEKQKNLNYYQQLVKNIVNANLVASGRVKKRDLVIEDRERDIENLSATVENQQNEIQKNTALIANVQTNYEKQKEATIAAFKAKKETKAKMEKQLAMLEQQSQAQIAALHQKNNEAQNQIENTRAALEAKNRQAEQLLNNLNEKENQYQKSIADLNKQHEAEANQARAEFENNLRAQKLSDDARIAQEKAFAAGEAKKLAAYKDQLGNLQSDLEHTRNQMKGIEGKYQSSIKSLEDTNKNLAGDLASAQRKLEAQKRLAQSIEDNFAKAGIKASVDGKSGDVTIDFHDEYFDNGSADLKNGMRSVLEKAFPVYAKSLLDNPKIAKKINSVEIVGFASPTYKGRSVDPNSLTAEDRAAVNYNMDLSYKRAKSIFEYVTDPNRMKFSQQQEILPMLKVSGRSYLASDKLPGRSTASSGENFCSVYDCKKSQRVIIKFNLREE